MRAEQFQLALRPRPPWEAVDLGVRMTQDAAPSLLRAYLPFAALLAVASLATVEVAGWLPVLLMAWAKPWLERGLLFLYARQAFGEATTFSQAWAARAAAPWMPLLLSLTWRRFSPWRAFTAPVTQLEGQRGAARAKRLRQLANGQRGTAAMSQFMFGLVEASLVLALIAAIGIVTPGFHWEGIGPLLQQDGANTGLDALLSGVYAIVMVFVTPFHTAAGFALYLNRRADLEAWDVEQDLREAFAGSAA